jgi:hypothetical protein
MKINGKDYEFKYPTIALVKQANAIVKKSELLNNIEKLIEAETTSDEWHLAVNTWMEFCECVLVQPDHDIDLIKISPADIAEVSRSFFVLAVAGPTAPKS